MLSREQWSQNVRIELIKRNESIGDMAKALGYSKEWGYANVYGRYESPKMIAEISKYLGVKNYLGVDDDEAENMGSNS